jgi:hypothetical protein
MTNQRETANPQERWLGQGVEAGTNDKVLIEGTSAEDVRKKASGRAYEVILHSIWKAKT